MSKSHRISTIKQLVEVVNDDNVEVLKHDIGEFLDLVVASRYLNPLITVKDYFTWNDDGEKGVNAVHFIDTEDKIVATVPVEVFKDGKWQEPKPDDLRLTAEEVV